MSAPTIEHEYQLLTDDNRVITWHGVDGPDAARRAADCLHVTVVATRTAPVHVAVVHHTQIIG